MLTTTSLKNPVFLRRIRHALSAAWQGRGHEWGGHAHRCYVPNRKGANVLRIDIDNGEEVVWQGNRNVTDIVMNAAMPTGKIVATVGNYYVTQNYLNNLYTVVNCALEPRSSCYVTLGAAMIVAEGLIEENE